MKFSFWAFATLVAVIKFTPAFALAPSAGADTATTSNLLAVKIDVLANDFREPTPTSPTRAAVPGTDTVTMLSTPTSGSVTVDANGVVTYTPLANFTGSASFTYLFTVAATSTDANKGLSATGNVTVTVFAPIVPINRSVSNADAIFLTQNTLQTLGLRGGALSQAQFDNAFTPVTNGATSLFPVFAPESIPKFANGFNSVTLNFASVFANFQLLNLNFGN